MNKLRLSYSMINTYIYGMRDEAAGIIRTWNGKPQDFRESIVNVYLRNSSNVTHAMNRGQKFDKYIKEYVEKHKSFPKEFNNIKLNDPVPALTIEVDYNDEFTLKGELDVWDCPIIYEIKNSPFRDSADYIDDFQVALYLYMANILRGMKKEDNELLYNFSKANRGILLRYDPYKKQYDQSIIYPSERRFMQVERIIEENGPKIKQILIQEGVL